MIGGGLKDFVEFHTFSLTQDHDRPGSIDMPSLQMQLVSDWYNSVLTIPSVGCWLVQPSTIPAPKLEGNSELCCNEKNLCCCNVQLQLENRNQVGHE